MKWLKQQNQKTTPSSNNKIKVTVSAIPFMQWKHVVCVCVFVNRNTTGENSMIVKQHKQQKTFYKSKKSAQLTVFLEWCFTIDGLGIVSATICVFTRQHNRCGTTSVCCVCVFACRTRASSMSVAVWLCECCSSAAATNRYRILEYAC